jgi:murein DD-endopeptidase MepM/ murein hydrolase activator NlpD
MKTSVKLALGIVVILFLVAGFFIIWQRKQSPRSVYVWQWLKDPQAHPEWMVKAGQRCGAAPFEIPSSGYIGYLWDDLFHIGKGHQGIDIFAGTKPGITPVYAAYDGYLTRLPEWKSSVIVRIPHDPLEPSRQIWTYYTHLADSDGKSYIDARFPTSTTEQFIEAGTLLGYQGDYSGDVNNPVGVHLHFSIVQDDGQGRFLNELEIGNTLDPSSYLGLPLNGRNNRDRVPVCQ